MDAAGNLTSPDSSSLQQSFALLYSSSELGVVIAREAEILDANDAFLKMIGYTREEMLASKIDWWGMTVPEHRPLDLKAMQQLRDYGTCAPYEKEYILRDGSRLPFMIGAVALSTEPLTWAAYIVDLSNQKKAIAAEQRARDLLSKSTLVNQLAHEINNPLAALTFLLHLLETHPDIASAEVKKLLSEAACQLQRVTEAVKQVLAVSQESA